MFNIFRNWREEKDNNIIAARYHAFIDVIQYVMVLLVVFLIMGIFMSHVLVAAFMCFLFLMHSWLRWSLRMDKIQNK